MINKNRGFSLIVLIIAIAVIIIITTTAIISVKDFDKDKDISNFMSDLDTVKQYVIEYYAQNDTLPVQFENGVMISAENELVDLLTKEKALSQVSEEDTGDYYYVDINKLGKIHLSNYDRGYIINEGSLNVYVTKPCTYEGNDYYTLTLYLLGKDMITNDGINFQIHVMGNPITWSKEAEILVSVPNINFSGEAKGWNFKWGKTSEITSGDKSRTNFFTYGDTIKITENGVYTIIVENPEGKALERRIVVSKIDNIPPVVMYSDGQLYIDDAETGVVDIRCKIKETDDFEIDDETRQEYTKYYTMNAEKTTDTPEDLVENYLWGDKNIKGEKVEDYLKEYEEYYEKLSRYNSIIEDSESTSGERENAVASIESLNNMYPQFSYNNVRFPDSEKNIVIYVEDEAGNGTVYSALSRAELRNCEYISGDAKTLLNSKVIINNNDRYTNNRNVNLFLQAMYAKYVFVTEEKVPTATWEEFDSDNMKFTLSSGDEEKIVYAFFKDESGKIASAYDRIYLDTTVPSDDPPTVEYNENSGISIQVNQTDTDVVNNVETQSGLTGIYQYGVKEESESNYVWYPRISSIPKFYKAGTYNIVTKATDKAGNERVSRPASITIKSSNTSLLSLKVGDYVNYGTYIDSASTYTTDTAKTGHGAQEISRETSTKWRVLSVNKDTGEVIITTDSAVNSGIYLSGATGFDKGADELNNICRELYSSNQLGLSARSMTINDLNYANDHSSSSIVKYAFYPNGTSVSGVTEDGYNKVQHFGTGTYKEGRFPKNAIDKGGNDVADAEYRIATADNPVYLTKDFDSYTLKSEVSSVLGSSNGWLASNAINAYGGDNGIAAFFVMYYVDSSINGGVLYASYDGAQTSNAGLRPVVSLQSSKIQLDVNDTTKNGSSAENAWQLAK